MEKQVEKFHGFAICIKHLLNIQMNEQGLNKQSANKLPFGLIVLVVSGTCFLFFFFFCRGQR